MILSSTDITEELKLKNLVIKPLAEKAIQPASIDLRLGNEFMYYDNGITVFDFEKDRIEDHMTKVEKDEFILLPHKFVLAIVHEYVEIPTKLVGRLEGKSSIARLGLIVHNTAGFIDSGFKGHIVLEIVNHSPISIKLKHKMEICQLSLHKLESEPLLPYGHPDLGSHYQGQKGVTASKYGK